MAFRENLLKKVKIVAQANTVLRSIGLSDSGQRIDREAMRHLLELGSYANRRERDLDLYFIGDSVYEQMILVLDNELKIYNTTVEDVALRKSPTVKEMISIRNAIKILNDNDVVVSRKADTVKRIQADLINDLDLSFTAGDIEALAQDGRDAIKNKYSEGLIEVLTLFADLLGYKNAPKVFQSAHTHIWGTLVKDKNGGLLFGPAVIYNLMRDSLKMVRNPSSSMEKVDVRQFQRVAKGDVDADIEGDEVLDLLKKAVME